jgi:hypothetical protein
VTYNDPYNYIYKQLSNIRYDVDLQREELKRQIDEISDEVLNELNNFEIDCKQNLTEQDLVDSIEAIKHETTDLFSGELNSLNEQIRTPNLNETRVDYLIRQVEKTIQENSQKLDQFKGKLLLKKDVSFEKSSFRVKKQMVGSLKMENQKPNMQDAFKTCLSTISNAHSHIIDCVEVISSEKSHVASCSRYQLDKILHFFMIDE